MASSLHGPSAGALEFPDRIPDDTALEDVLTRPQASLINFIPSLSSPLVVLGGGGKMGPTLGLLAKRAAVAARHPLEVIVVSRFTDTRARDWLEAKDIRTHACDLLDSSSVRRLPESENVVYLVGLKFGTGRNPSATWAANTLVPAHVCERYSAARIVALSTGNVYPLTLVANGGAIEDHALTPIGEYPNAAVARERIFQYFSDRLGIRVCLLRLFYAVELRYGVLVDIARSVLREEPVPLLNGHLNCIWQGDANEMILRSFALAECPPTVWNLCRPEIFSVRRIAEMFGRYFGKKPWFRETEAETAMIGNSARLVGELGHPGTTLNTMGRWVSHWVKEGGTTLDRPTHFEVRDGRF
jgi:nucleoside-diphosphate-sugar epimerase